MRSQLWRVSAISSFITFLFPDAAEVRLQIDIPELGNAVDGWKDNISLVKIFIYFLQRQMAQLQVCGAWRGRADPSTFWKGGMAGNDLAGKL